MWEQVLKVKSTHAFAQFHGGPGWALKENHCSYHSSNTLGNIERLNDSCELHWQWEAGLTSMISWGQTMVWKGPKFSEVHTGLPRELKLHCPSTCIFLLFEVCFSYRSTRERSPFHPQWWNSFKTLTESWFHHGSLSHVIKLLSYTKSKFHYLKLVCIGAHRTYHQSLLRNELWKKMGWELWLTSPNTCPEKLQ